MHDASNLAFPNMLIARLMVYARNARENSPPTLRSPLVRQYPASMLRFIVPKGVFNNGFSLAANCFVCLYPNLPYKQPLVIVCLRKTVFRHGNLMAATTGFPGTFTGTALTRFAVIKHSLLFGFAVEPGV